MCLTQHAAPDRSRRAIIATAFVGATNLAIPASAYERRDVGDDGRSAATAAMNTQAFETNNRLEKSGFKLDTREEETAKLSSALSSFSYDSSSAKTKSGSKWATATTEKANASSKK